MAANYKQTNANGTMWTRCKQIHINNPLDGVSTVQMAEEEAISIADKTITQPGRVINGTFNPDTVFDLIHPYTGDVIGQTTHMQVYVILYSLWLSMAKAQDALHDMIHTPSVIPVITPTAVEGDVSAPQEIIPE